jgi:hypothetical protein
MYAYLYVSGWKVGCFQVYKCECVYEVVFVGERSVESHTYTLEMNIWADARHRELECMRVFKATHTHTCTHACMQVCDMCSQNSIPYMLRWKAQLV